ncbi:MAG TPA: PA2169 family four-helix-bundle protein [Alphaproteobacteria bacterium]|nr:PA2169 family four-helix-bundle protein [Alphaproteobacteria bacterium]
MRSSREVEILNQLIAACIDSAEGYADAAEHVRDGALQRRFASRAAERRMIALDLQNQVRQRGCFPAHAGTAAGRIGRLFADLRAMAMRSDKDVIETVEHSEDAIRESFERALTGDISGALRQVINGHFGRVQAGHDEAGALKHAAE